MTTTNHIPSGAPAGHARRSNLTLAWVAVALIPVAFILAFAVGEGLYALLGYKPEDATEPLWVALVAGVPAIVLFLVPCAAAVRYGNRARLEGHRVALVPLVIGAVLGLWMVLINTVTLFAG
jgi:hypothetical protein